MGHLNVLIHKHSVFFFSLFLLAGLLLPMASAQAEVKCRASTPKLSMKTATTRTKYVRTKSSKDLSQLHGAGPGAAIGGLGGGETGFKVENQYEITGQGSTACVKLKRVKVTFYAKPKIHIASNFGRSTCEYAAVMGHEKGHIRILRKFVREYSPKAKREMAKIIRGVDSAMVVPKSQIQTAQNEIQKEFMEKLKAYNERIMPVLEKRQNAHDNPREYARVDAKCRKWDQKLAKD